MGKENECPDCTGRGWYVEEDRHGMQVQAQCESCCGRGELQDTPRVLDVYSVSCQCAECDDYTTFSLTEQELKYAWQGNYENECKHCGGKGVSFYPVGLLHADGHTSRADDLAERLVRESNASTPEKCPSCTNGVVTRLVNSAGFHFNAEEPITEDEPCEDCGGTGELLGTSQG